MHQGQAEQYLKSVADMAITKEFNRRNDKNKQGSNIANYETSNIFYNSSAWDDPKSC